MVDQDREVHLAHSHFRFCDRSPHSHVVVQWKGPLFPVLPLDLEKYLTKAEPGMGDSHLPIDEVGLQMEQTSTNKYQFWGQQVDLGFKVSAVKPGGLRRESTPQTCPLTSSHLPWPM